MADPALLPLLELQRHDQRAAELERSLAEIPARRAAVEASIKTSREALSGIKAALQQKEVKRKALDTELLTLDARIVQLKAQEVMAKKKEAFEALGHEIEAAKSRSAAIEDEELVLLEEIEKNTAALAGATTAQAVEEKGLHQKLADLSTEEAALKAEQAATVAAALAARQSSPTLSLAAYDNVRKTVKRFPIIVPVVKHVCKGCHLKVSQEAWEKALHQGNLARCDQCGRLVWGEQ